MRQGKLVKTWVHKQIAKEYYIPSLILRKELDKKKGKLFYTP